MATAAESNVSSLVTLKSKRERLASHEQKIRDAFEGQLIDSLTEFVSGVQVSGKQSSFTPTVTLKAKGKKDGQVRNLSITIAPRVRAVREAEEFEVHINDDNQLQFGWIETDEDTESEGDDDHPGGEGFED